MLFRFLLLAFFFTFGISAQAADLSDLDAAYPRQPLEAVTTAGQPSIEDFEYFASHGYVLVINLRLPGEFDDFDEQQVVENLGMSYVNIPVKGSGEMTDENAKKLHQVLESAGGPVLLHCTVGMRASVLLGLEGYLFHDLSQKEASALGTNAHMTHSGSLIKRIINDLERDQ